MVCLTQENIKILFCQHIGLAFIFFATKVGLKKKEGIVLGKTSFGETINHAEEIFVVVGTA